MPIAELDTASKHTYSKYTTAAPVTIALMPLGAKGDQFDPSTSKVPINMTRITIIICKMIPITTEIVIIKESSKVGYIYTDRTILAAQLPVFCSMFSYNLKEELSAVDISGMSIEACQAFIIYIYVNVQADEFLTHRLALLRAADKYAIADLREACHESLTEDIDTKNVLERQQTAYLYRLPKLNSSCMRYLVNFGKVYDIGDDFNAFLQCAERDLIVEIFHDILSAWKDF